MKFLAKIAHLDNFFSGKVQVECDPEEAQPQEIQRLASPHPTFQSRFEEHSICDRIYAKIACMFCYVALLMVIIPIYVFGGYDLRRFVCRCVSSGRMRWRIKTLSETTSSNAFKRVIGTNVVGLMPPIPDVTAEQDLESATRACLCSVTRHPTISTYSTTTQTGGILSPQELDGKDELVAQPCGGESSVGDIPKLAVQEVDNVNPSPKDVSAACDSNNISLTNDEDFIDDPLQPGAENESHSPKPTDCLFLSETECTDLAIKAVLPWSSSLFWAHRRGELLGKGRCGEIYLCQIDGKLRVVKKLTNTRRLYAAREAAIMRELDHPNILSVYASARYWSSKYLVLEHVDGTDLRTLERVRPTDMPEYHIATVLREVAQGLAHVHDKGYIHCDIKPENILVSKRAEIKIANFGLARDSRMKADLQLFGSCQYMPPEHAEGVKTAAGDIWSLGILAIVLLTRRSAYPEILSEDDIKYMLNAKVVPPLPQKASSEFANFLRLLLNPDHTTRATAKDVLELSLMKRARLQVI